MSSQQENTILKPKVLEVKNVFRTYHHEDTNIVVLENVSFDIYEDEFVSLVGPSGCGKSTLLRIIVGLDRPTRGEVLYRGKKVEGVNPKTALVFQNFALIPWLTVWQNVELGLEARGKNSRRLLNLSPLDTAHSGLHSIKREKGKLLSPNNSSLRFHSRHRLLPFYGSLHRRSYGQC